MNAWPDKASSQITEVGITEVLLYMSNTCGNKDGDFTSNNSHVHHYSCSQARMITLEIADLASLIVLFRTSFILSLGAADMTISSRICTARTTLGFTYICILVHAMYCKIKGMFFSLYIRVQYCRRPSANFRPFNKIGRSKLLTIGRMSDRINCVSACSITARSCYPRILLRKPCIRALRNSPRIVHANLGSAHIHPGSRN